MLETQLAQLEQSELVRRLDDSDMAYLFKHTLVQETARSGLLNHERKRLHRMVADCLEDLYPERRGELAPLLAQHFAVAGDQAKTLEYSILAGDVATRVNAITEAEQQYRRALELAERPDAPSKELKEIFLKLGRVLEIKNEYSAAAAHYRRMLALAQERRDRPFELAATTALGTIHSIPSTVYDPEQAQQLNDRALALARELDDKAAQATILWSLMLKHSRVGRGFKIASGYGEEALKIARENNLRERLAYLLNDMAPMLVYHGEPERGIQYNLEARAMWEEFQNLPMYSGNFGYAAMIHLIIGNFDQAIAASEAGVALSREINNAWNEAFTQAWIGEAYLERGDVERAETVMRAAIRLGETVFPPTLVFTRTDLARLYADFGEIEAAIALGKQALEVAEKRFPAMRPAAVSALVHPYILKGEIEEARQLLISVPDILSYQESPVYEIQTTLAKMELAQAEGDPERVLMLSEALLAMMNERKLHQLQPEALLYRAYALMDRGRLEEAGETLAQALAFCDVMEARWSRLKYEYAMIRLAEARGNAEAAQAHRVQARALIQAFAARTPERLRAGFLERALVGL